ncbi:MAG: phosphate acyltransferase PlsX, partial [Planctomycetota bacterium]
MSLAIAVDAMSGASPGDVVRGAMAAARTHPDVRFVLVGREEALREEIERAGGSAANVELVGAERAIEAGEPPVEAIRRRTGSSLEVAARLLRTGEVSAFVTAGGPGACVAAASILLGLLPGVRRAALAVSLPAGTGSVVVIDAGANLASRAEHLIQYGIMGSLYAKTLLGRDSPRVGLLVFGGEPEEADPVLEGARAAFRGSRLNFVGDVEGADVFRGGSDVVVCD